jgi:hypothetical protein
MRTPPGSLGPMSWLRRLNFGLRIGPKLCCVALAEFQIVTCADTKTLRKCTSEPRLTSILCFPFPLCIPIFHIFSHIIHHVPRPIAPAPASCPELLGKTPNTALKSKNLFHGHDKKARDLERHRATMGPRRGGCILVQHESHLCRRRAL